MQWSSLLFYSAISVMQPTGGERDNILPSWKAGPVRHGIIERVERMAREASPEYVPIGERVAVVVGDGVLWNEVVARADNMTSLPEDVTGLAGYKRYSESIRAFLCLEGPEAIGARYREFAFRPMQELIALLKEYDFQIWLLSSGDHEVDRVMAELSYGLARDKSIELSDDHENEHQNGLTEAIWKRIGATPKVLLSRSSKDKKLATLRDAGILQIQITKTDGQQGQLLFSTSDLRIHQDDPESFVVSPEGHWHRKYVWQTLPMKRISKK